MSLWIVWLVIAVVLGVGEMVTLTAVSGLLAGAALLASGSAALGLPLVGQLLVFAGASLAGLVLLRPVVARHSRSPLHDRFGVAALPGRTARVLREVTGETGVVRIGGEEWTARALDQSMVISAGATVDVILIDGATAVVNPRE